MRRVMSRRKPTSYDPPSEALIAAWRGLVIRQHQGGGNLNDRLRLAEAVEQVELRLLRRMWAEPTVDPS